MRFSEKGQGFLGSVFRHCTAFAGEKVCLGAETLPSSSLIYAPSLRLAFHRGIGMSLPEQFFENV